MRRGVTLRFRFPVPMESLKVVLHRMHVLLVAAGLPVLAACAASPAGPDAALPIASLIVKPRAAAAAEDVTRVAQDRLGRDAGVRYARPLAGGAHMLYLTAPAKREQVPALIERLRASDAFQFVELDSMMKVQ